MDGQHKDARAQRAALYWYYARAASTINIVDLKKCLFTVANTIFDIKNHMSGQGKKGVQGMWDLPSQEVT